MRKFKELMGPDFVRRYTEGQLIVLRQDMHDAAKLLLAFWIEKKEREAGTHPRPIRTPLDR